MKKAPDGRRKFLFNFQLYYTTFYIKSQILHSHARCGSMDAEVIQMEFPLMPISGLASGADRAQSVAHAAARAGLTLTDGDVRSICAACERALRESNRIELEPGLPEAFPLP